MTNARVPGPREPIEEDPADAIFRLTETAIFTRVRSITLAEDWR